MVIRRGRQIGLVRVQIVDKNKIGLLGAAAEPAENTFVQLVGILPVQIVKTPCIFVSELQNSGSQQGGCQIMPEGNTVINVILKALRDSPTFLQVKQVGGK